MHRASELEACIKTDSNEIDRIFSEEAPMVPLRDRSRYILMLTAIHQFFSDVGFSNTAQLEVLELGHALLELDDGTVRPFLKPTVAQNRTVDYGDIWVARAFIAIAIDHIASLGWSRRSACEYVAKHCDFLRYTLAPKSKSKTFATTIENWCRSFKSGSVKSDRAELLFKIRTTLIDECMDDLRSKGQPVEPIAVFNILLFTAIDNTAKASDVDAIASTLQDPRAVRKKPPL